MKHIAIGFLWAFTFAWAGNYVAMAAGVSPIVTSLVAVALGVAIATRPYVSSLKVVSAPTSTNPAAESPVRP
jgi:hypothetical protein